MLDGDVGRASLMLAQVPDDARCLEILASSPGRSLTRRFDLVPGTSAEEMLQGLPLGAVGFSAVTDGVACAMVTPGFAQTWMSDTVTVTLVVGQAVPVKLTLRRPGRATVSIDFSDEPSIVDGGPAGGADADAGPPPSCQIGPFADGDVWDKTYVSSRAAKPGRSPRSAPTARRSG